VDLVGGAVEGFFDLLADEVLLALLAVQVDVMQDADTIASPRGDLGGCGAGVEPQGQGGVPRIVRAAGEWVAARSGPSAPRRAACQARP
jgi:hypothetical protein